MRNFSLKFIDMMVGIVLGLGFQWWPVLEQPWQYAAFIFVYIDIIDYWIDYSPSLKKFPPKREIDVILDVAIVFTLFLYIYATQLTVIYFLTVFAVFKVLDYFWLLSSKYEYNPTGIDKLFLNTWLNFNLIEVAVSMAFIGFIYFISIPTIVTITAFMVFRLAMRISASLSYKKVHFV